MTGSGPSLTAVRLEVVRHHEEITNWLTGRTNRFSGGFDVLEQAHLPDFTMVDPEGEALNRAVVLTGLEAAHGTVPSLQITIVDVELVVATTALVVATYVERQHAGGEQHPSRRSTAVLSSWPGSARMCWLHLQETWVACVS